LATKNRTAIANDKNLPLHDEKAGRISEEGIKGQIGIQVFRERFGKQERYFKLGWFCHLEFLLVNVFCRTDFNIEKLHSFVRRKYGSLINKNTVFVILITT
jgi:hypothetical protein